MYLLYKMGVFHCYVRIHISYQKTSKPTVPLRILGYPWDWYIANILPTLHHQNQPFMVGMSTYMYDINPSNSCRQIYRSSQGSVMGFFKLFSIHGFAGFQVGNLHFKPYPEAPSAYKRGLVLFKLTAISVLEGFEPTITWREIFTEPFPLVHAAISPCSCDLFSPNVCR